jgi:hypothetical protein
MIEAFLVGVIATASLTAATFFLKFWKKSHDTLFLAFVVYFLTEGRNPHRTPVFCAAKRG